jgi:hypothetical protein
MNVINNTALVNNNPTVPSVYFTFDNTNGATVYNDGDAANYGNGDASGNVVITTSNKKNGTYSALFGQTAVGKITIPNFNITTTNGGYSLGFWFNITDISQYEQTIFSSDNILLLKLGPVFRYKINTVVSNVTFTFTNNTWVHFYMTHATDGTMNMYFNNVLTHTNNITYFANNTANANNKIGVDLADTSTKRYFGYIDDFRYYNRILSNNERGWVYTNIFPVDLNYLDNNSYFQINASGLPFVNRGFGKAPLALCRLTQTDNSIISDNEVILNKPNEIGSLTLELVDVFANAIGAKLLSDTSFIIQIEGS